MIIIIGFEGQRTNLESQHFERFCPSDLVLFLFGLKIIEEKATSLGTLVSKLSKILH